MSRYVSPKYLSVIALLVVSLMIVAGCAPAALPTAVPPTAAPQPTAAPAEPTAAPAEPTAAPAEPTTAAAEPTTEAGGEYSAEIRPATQRWKIGYGDGLAGIPFTETVTRNINAVAEEMGVDIVYCDNAYDQEKTVACSNNLVTQEVDGVIFANWIAGTEELISGIFQDAGVPCVAYDGPHPNCVAFGPDNYVAAKEAGKYLGEYAVAQGWDPSTVQLLLVWSPDVPVHQARAEGATDGVKEVIDIPEANIHNIPHKELSDVQPNVTTWATAHPDAEHVLCFGHSDQPGVDCALALEQAGFLGRAVAVGTGASDEALVDLRDRTDEESVFKATISYFPERYGTYLVPIIVDLLEGRDVPERIIPAVEPVTRENVMELYPGN